MGLGYPTLHRYDPRRSANEDSRFYYKRVEGMSAPSDGHWRYRVLIPELARPLATFARGRVGTWSPVFLGLLAVNAAFVAAAAVLLLRLGMRFGFPPGTALGAALLVLCDCLVVNEHLAGMVDSAELLALVAAAVALASGRWGRLVFVAVAGAFAKETIVPLLTLFAIGWWIGSSGGSALSVRKKAPAIAVAAVAGMLSVSAIHAVINGHWTWPWSMALNEHFSGTYPHPIVSFLTDGPTLLSFGLLVPLALVARRQLPRPWIFAALVSSAGALALGLWNDAGPNINRPIFNCAGPLLCLAAASVLVNLTRKLDRFRVGPSCRS